RGRYRKNAVLRAYGTAADIDSGTSHFLDSKQVECDAGADHIRNRIHRAYFVKVHLLNRNIMRLCFRFSKAPKYRQRTVPGLVRKLPLLNDLFDVRQVSTFLLLLKGNRKLRRRNSFALYLLDTIFGLQIETLQGCFELLPVRTRV